MSRNRFPLVTSAVAAVLSLFSTLAQAKPVEVDLPAQPLTASIQQLSRLSGLSIGGDATLVDGKSAPAVKGTFEPVDALNRLLSGSGLKANVDGNTLIIARAATRLREVSVDAQAPEGAAELGYKVETVRNVGPWGERSLRETPYSMSVMSSELIANTLARDTAQLSRMNPTIQASTPNAVLEGASQVIVRGFSNTVAQDGVPTRFTSNSSGISLEDVERVEVLNGPSTFLNDASSVGGVVNFVAKRPTAERLTNLTVGNYGGEQYYVHADLGGPIDSGGKLRYRLNLVGQDGDTVIKGDNIQRTLASGAVDWQPTEDLLVQLTASRRKFKQEGSPPYWNSTGPLAYTFVPDNRGRYTQDFVGSDSVTTKYGIRTTWKISDAVTLRANYVDNTVKGEFNVAARNIIVDRTTLNQFLLPGGPAEYDDQGGSTYLDFSFNTARVTHKLTVGYGGDLYYAYASTNAPTFVQANGLSFDNPQIPRPPFIATLPRVRYNQNYSRRDGFKLGDDIQFSEQWSALVGASYSRILDLSRNVAGVTTNGYQDHKVTPTMSILYKPIPWLTTYGTYIEELEAGTLVSQNYNNFGEVLSPYVSKQYELGAKADAGGMSLTAALFRLEKQNSYEVPTLPRPTLTKDGQQNHQGVELTATGKLTQSLTIVGGVTWLDASIDKTSNVAIKGKRPTQVADKLIKLYAEYNVPMLPGLFLTGGAYYTGSSYADGANAIQVPSYTVGDVGARYLTGVLGRETVFRLDVQNVTDKAYWASPFAIGEPRTFAFSATMKF
ncbi:MAG: TonB-dependent receptor [Gammaproteobacteria bacterium]